jgi:nitrite reductase/ring-hydroxylating ferredoxin subunit
MTVVVCSTDDLAPGEKQAVRVGRRNVVVGRSAEGRCWALADVCPHQGAQLSSGHLGGNLVFVDGVCSVERQGEILRCPWHNFAFDVTTGRSLLEPERYRVATYRVTIEDGYIVLPDLGDK